MHGILYVTSFFAAGLTMFALARAVTGQFVPALVAGVLFGFYPYRISTYSHLEMQGVFLMPFALLCCCERSRRDAHGTASVLGLRSRSRASGRSISAPTSPSGSSSPR